MFNEVVGKTQESHIINHDSLDSIISCMNRRGYLLTKAEHFTKTHYLITMTYHGKLLPPLDGQQEIINRLRGKYIQVD